VVWGFVGGGGRRFSVLKETNNTLARL